MTESSNEVEPSRPGGRRRPIVAVAVVIALMGLAALAGALVFGGNGGSTGRRIVPNPNRADTPERYAELASLLASPLLVEGEVPDQLSLAEQAVDLRFRESRLVQSAADCRDLARFAESQLGTFDAARALQAKQPAIEGLFVAVAYTAIGIAAQDFELAKTGGTATADQVAAVSGYLREWKSIQVAAEANAIEFARTMPSRFSGRMQERPFIGAAFDEDADFFSLSTKDVLTLTNGADVALHDCVVVVRLKGESGETFTNVHFVKEWPSGAKRVAVYDSGPFGHTVSDPVTVTVEAWAREASSPAAVIHEGLIGW